MATPTWKTKFPESVIVPALIASLDHLIATATIEAQQEGQTRFNAFFDKENESLPDVDMAGRVLNEIGGSGLMLYVLKNHIPERHQRELEISWHGIGDWKV